MKNGKNPTLSQKKMMKSHGLIPDNWLVVKDISEYLEVISRIEAKKVGTKKLKTKKLHKNL